eukprot:4401549-Amphidinium_carterae.1
MANVLNVRTLLSKPSRALVIWACSRKQQLRVAVLTKSPYQTATNSIRMYTIVEEWFRGTVLFFVVLRANSWSCLAVGLSILKRTMERHSQRSASENAETGSTSGMMLHDPSPEECSVEEM